MMPLGLLVATLDLIMLIANAYHSFSKLIKGGIFEIAMMLSPSCFDPIIIHYWVRGQDLDNLDSEGEDNIEANTLIA